MAPRPRNGVAGHARRSHSYNEEVERTEKLQKISELIWQDEGRMSGAPCILGTRVRVQDLFDWMAGGGSVDSFSRAYSHIPRERIVAVLRLAESDLLKHLEAA